MDGPPGRPTAASSDLAEKLANPPPGFEPWNFPTIEGVPLLKGEAATRLARLAALTTRADLVDELAPSLIREYLTKAARIELLGDREYEGDWGRGDEFVLAERRKRFHDEYSKAFREIAPKAPFQFGYLSEARLRPYDEARSAFPIGLGGLELQEALRRAGFRSAFPDFQTPRLELTVRDDPAGFLRGLDHRAVAVVQRVIVTSVAPDALRYRLTSLDIYTPDLKRLLAKVPVINDAPAFLSASPPSKLTTVSPAPLDDLAFCAAAVAALGAGAPKDTLTYCWNIVGDRDAKFYSSGRQTPLAPDDARRPFFPRGGANMSPDGLAAFVRWAQAVTAGLLGAEFSRVSDVSRGDDKADQVTAYALQASSFQEETSRLIHTEDLQDDQVASLGDIRGVAILGAAPNRAALYSVAVERSVIQQRARSFITMNSTFHLTSAKLLQTGRQPVLLLRLTPKSATVSSGSERLAERRFDDIPALNQASFVANETAPAPAAGDVGSPGVLDAAAFDLLTAAAVGERLSKEALAHLVTRRWVLENGSPGPRTNRFFQIGKRKPTPNEAAELASQFVKWAQAQGKAPPVQFTISDRVTVARDQTIVPWAAFSCLKRSVAELMTNVNATMGANSELGSCKQKRDQGQPVDERRCIAVEASLAAAGHLNGVGCVREVNLGFPDPLVLSVRTPQDLPAPTARPELGKTSTDFDLTATLEVASVSVSRTPPRAVDALPGPMRAALGVGPAPTAEGKEYVTIEARLQEARFIDPKDLRTATTRPAATTEVDRLAAAFANVSAPTEASLPARAERDLLGVRLGMSFEEAEAIVRSAFEVGHVYVGARGSALQISAARPLSSGKLFVSKDGREAFALIDEPPAAAGRVVAAWRMLFIQPFSVPNEEIFGSIEKKYGKQTWGSSTVSLAANKVYVWPTNSSASCDATSRVAGTNAVSQGWLDGSAPLARISEYDFLKQTPPIPAFEQLPFDLPDCGPIVTMFYFAPGAGAQVNELGLSLFDPFRYREIYSESRRLVAKNNPSPPVKF